VVNSRIFYILRLALKGPTLLIFYDLRFDGHGVLGRIYAHLNALHLVGHDGCWVAVNFWLANEVRGEVQLDEAPARANCQCT
jgi:hypothetical protein